MKNFREADEEFIPTPADSLKREEVKQDQKSESLTESESVEPETKPAEPVNNLIEAKAPAEKKEPLETPKNSEGDDDIDDDSLDFVDTSKIASKEIETKSRETEGGNPSVEAEPAAVLAAQTEKKRSLTDREFWTIILTPDLDAKAFKASKKILIALLKLFRVKFENCFVEGIRMNYLDMGYGAALNGILKSFPYVGAWDFRMDWTSDHELRAEGHVLANVNLCRLIGLLLVVLVYAGTVFFSFWRRRKHVLKTNELPTLGWIRKKIVNLMAEE